jgi:hypothetical protein
VRRTEDFADARPHRALDPFHRHGFATPPNTLSISSNGTLIQSRSQLLIVMAHSASFIRPAYGLRNIIYNNDANAFWSISDDHPL